jgi:hypothetical protein
MVWIATGAWWAWFTAVWKKRIFIYIYIYIYIYANENIYKIFQYIDIRIEGNKRGLNIIFMVWIATGAWWAWFTAVLIYV